MFKKFFISMLALMVIIPQISLFTVNNDNKKSNKPVEIYSFTNHLNQY